MSSDDIDIQSTPTNSKEDEKEEQKDTTTDSKETEISGERTESLEQDISREDDDTPPELRGSADFQRLTPLVNSANESLDVDPELVVHRFSRTTGDGGDDAPGDDYGYGEGTGTDEGENQDPETYGSTEGYWTSATAETPDEDTEANHTSGEHDEEPEHEHDENSWEEEEDTFQAEPYSGEEEEEEPEHFPPTTDEEEHHSATPPPSEKRKSGGKEPEMTKNNFRWFERKILLQQIPPGNENQRRLELLEKCQMGKKTSKPIVTIMEAKPDVATSSSSIQALREFNSKASKVGGSKASLEGRSSPPREGSGAEGAPAEGAASAEKQEEKEDDGATKFAGKDWALKNTLDFLTSAPCETTSGKLKSVTQEALALRVSFYEKQVAKKRLAIGSASQAPEITATLRRQAERAIWRSVIDNTKPRYPLPRFILPRHQFLRKVQEEFIGPGSYDIDLYEKMVKAKKLGLPSTWGPQGKCASRFPPDKEPPCTSSVVFRDPWPALEEANYRKKHPSTAIPFESTPCNYRGQALREGPGSRLPPNCYNIKSPLEEFIKKRTGLRGPYDCYTPSRGVIPYGYYQSVNDEEKARLGPGSYEVRTSLVKEMHDSYNGFKGKLGRTERDKMVGFKAAFETPLWPMTSSQIPSPGQYEVSRTIGSDNKQNASPFNVGKTENEFVKSELVAPDYYYYALGTTWTVPPKGASLSSVFNSHTPQIMTGRQHLVRKTRNRACNLNFDMEGGLHAKECHQAPVKSYKNAYVYENCKNPCMLEKGQGILDPFAIPGYGIGPADPTKAIDMPLTAIYGNCCNC